MSMISAQIDELNKLADEWNKSNMFELARMCREAADTIWQLRDDLQRANAENAKLREELEAVGTAAYLYGRYDLRAEMGKNRGRICPTCGCIVFDDEECCPDCNAEVDG